MKNSVNEKNGGLNDMIGRRYIIISFAFFFAGICTLGYYVFEKIRSETVKKTEDELISVSEMKIQEIEHWRKERIRNLENIQNEVSYKNSLYGYLFVSISIFSLAIALIFSSSPEVVSLIWLFESTILFFFFNKTKETKIFNAAIILFII